MGAGDEEEEVVVISAEFSTQLRHYDIKLLLGSCN